MRLKLIVVLTAIVAVFMFMCSCTANVEAKNYYSDTYYSVQVLGSEQGLRLYKVTVNENQYYILRSNGGLCILK